MILQVAIFHKCNGGIYNDLLPSRQAAAGEVQPYWLQCDAFVFDAPGFLKKNASILWQSLKGMHYGLLWPGILQKREREREVRKTHTVYHCIFKDAANLIKTIRIRITLPAAADTLTKKTTWKLSMARGPTGSFLVGNDSSAKSGILSSIETKVRNVGYKQSREKIASQFALYECIGMDIVLLAFDRYDAVHVLD